MSLAKSILEAEVKVQASSENCEMASRHALRHEETRNKTEQSLDQAKDIVQKSRGEISEAYKKNRDITRLVHKQRVRTDKSIAQLQRLLDREASEAIKTSRKAI